MYSWGRKAPFLIFCNSTGKDTGCGIAISWGLFGTLKIISAYLSDYSLAMFKMTTEDDWADIIPQAAVRSWKKKRTLERRNRKARLHLCNEINVKTIFAMIDKEAEVGKVEKAKRKARKNLESQEKHEECNGKNIRSFRRQENRKE